MNVINDFTVNKERFLSNYEFNSEQGKRFYEYLFNIMVPYENKLNKDCCEFTVSEIIMFYKSRFSSSSNSLLSMNSMLKIYTYYCLQNNLVPDYQNHYLELNPNICSDIIKSPVWEQRIIDRKDLLHICEVDLQNYSDKALLLCFFEGIDGPFHSEVSEIKADDIEGNRIHLVTGRTVTISNELVNFIKESCNQYEYYTFTESDDPRFTSKQYKADDPYMIKSMFNARNTHEEMTQIIARQRICSKMRRLRQFLDMNPAIDVWALKDSGKIYTIKEAMKGGKTLDEAIDDEQVIQRYGKELHKKNFLRLYEDQFIVREENL